MLLQDRDDRGVVTLTLNRPQAFNALSEAMLTALGEAIDALAEDTTVRARSSPRRAKRSAPGMTSRRCGPNRHWRTTSNYSSSAPR